jgi:hypothetical protein
LVLETKVRPFNEWEMARLGGSRPSHQGRPLAEAERPTPRKNGGDRVVSWSGIRLRRKFKVTRAAHPMSVSTNGFAVRTAVVRVLIDPVSSALGA